MLIYSHVVYFCCFFFFISYCFTLLRDFFSLSDTSPLYLPQTWDICVVCVVLVTAFDLIRMGPLLTTPALTRDFSFCCLVDTFNVYQDFQGPILLWVSLIYIVLLYGGNEHGKMKNHAHSMHIILSNFLWNSKTDVLINYSFKTEF